MRNVDADAPLGMRQELTDLFFHIAEHNSPPLDVELLQRVICQSLGTKAPGNPYGGFRYAAGRDIDKAEWPRVYDLICRLWLEFESAGVDEEFHQGVNRILSGYGVVWELTKKGHLQRHLPPHASSLVEIAFTQLSAPQFSSSLSLIMAAQEAFDDRPRRDRDACANIFDALESVAKQVFNMPNATFGNVLKNVRKRKAFQGEIISVLESINTLRNRKFGHGMTTPFDLSTGEVDFTYLSCIGAIILFANKV
ncbi:MAG: hypothetical protein OEV64_09105 [Desulfobulbaceae bacterium]|nr:hypothetical protein [Desulfobulbaceae bacterium]